MSIKNSNDPSGNRTRHLSVRSTVPQPTAPPSRLPHHHPIADSKCILHEGYLRCSQNIKSEQEISEYVIFLSICKFKRCEAPKNSPSTFSSEDGNSPGFRRPCLLLFIFGKIVQRRKFETFVVPNTGHVQFFSASIFPETFFVVTFTELHSRV